MLPMQWLFPNEGVVLSVSHSLDFRGCLLLRRHCDFHVNSLGKGEMKGSEMATLARAM